MTAIAEVIEANGTQTIKLPEGFRLDATTVAVRREGQAIVLEPVPARERVYETSVPPIEEVLAAIAAEVPAEEWQRLPADLSSDLDHYIYGTPRQ